MDYENKIYWLLQDRRNYTVGDFLATCPMLSKRR